MFQSISPLILRDDCESVSKHLTQGLIAAGYQVVRSFDLQRARGAHIECACPHHGEHQCNCQMIVLLIYLPNGDPHTLLAHGSDEITALELGDTLPEDEKKTLYAIIKNIFSQIPSIQESEIPLNI